MSEQLYLFGNPTSKPKARKPAANPKAAPAAPKDEVVHLRFEDAHQVRIVMVGGEPWWVLSDIAKALGYQRTSDASKHLRDKEKGTANCRTPGGKQNLVIVSEPGMYRLVMKSEKPDAERFQDWVCEEVLPSIRKHGVYSVAGPATKIQNKLKCDPATAMQRLSLTELNKLLHDTIKAHGGRPWEYGTFHNTIYDALAEATAKMMRESLGLPRIATPLDRLSRTLLVQCSRATEMTIRKIEDKGIIRGEELKFFRDALRDIIEADTRAMGEGYCLTLVQDESRGTIYDIVQPGLARPA